VTRTGSSANTPGGMAFNLLLFRYLEIRKINQLVIVMLQYIACTQTWQVLTALQIKDL